MMSKTAAEPLVRISKREGTTFVQKVLVRAIAILLALVVDAFFIFFVTGLNTPVSRLSGGNVQKVLVGRELAASPIVLMTAYAVRGLDINTSYTIYNLLNEQKEKGVAVIYVGEDLDVLLELCDRILVLCGGKANGMLDARTTTKEEVGLRMTNLVQKEGK